MRDETYILDICDRVLEKTAIRQHRFDFLRGDQGHCLPVDACYPDLKLVIEYHERQHAESVPFWDRKPTVSGVPRGQQRKQYDQRRRETLPKHGFALIELRAGDFPCRGNRRLARVADKDEIIIRAKLADWIKMTD